MSMDPQDSGTPSTGPNDPDDKISGQPGQISPGDDKPTTLDKSNEPIDDFNGDEDEDDYIVPVDDGAGDAGKGNDDDPGGQNDDDDDAGCTSPYLLLSTNDGVDWNPLSDALASLSISNSQYADAPPAAIPEVNHPELQTESLDPPAELEPLHMQDEMKRRSLILSELINFRESQAMNIGQPNAGHTDAHGHGYSPGDDDSAMSNMHRTLHSLLDLRRRSGMFILDDVDTGQLQFPADADMASGYVHPYGNGEYAGIADEEGMFDDPPADYVAAHPPVHDDGMQAHMHMPPYTHAHNVYQPYNGTAGSHMQDTAAQEMEDDDDSDEGQVYATPEQREQMKARRRELRMDTEAREREMLWRRCNIGDLGVGGNG
ncbi:hypothetical protein Dda_5660 [Drechslerella dactyloides]|uniref:Uncharacterized protein n=1 Tax=Drechslerella dactyloides TaxID=74499 RepID=A0AAD6IWH4_DREDA|nr:hypothetical protein Dda_5660 [Drechslerella dactyloides]